MPQPVEIMDAGCGWNPKNGRSGMKQKQASLFDITSLPEEAVGLAGMMPAIRAAMNRTASEYEPGRKLLVDAVIEIAKREAVPMTPGGGKAVTQDMLDKWLQPSDRGHAPSLEMIMCFCLATGDASPIKPILQLLGLCAVSQRDFEYLEYGKACAAARAARETKRKLEARL